MIVLIIMNMVILAFFIIMFIMIIIFLVITMIMIETTIMMISFNISFILNILTYRKQFWELMFCVRNYAARSMHSINLLLLSVIQHPRYAHKHAVVILGCLRDWSSWKTIGYLYLLLCQLNVRNTFSECQSKYFIIACTSYWFWGTH